MTAGIRVFRSVRQYVDEALHESRAVAVYVDRHVLREDGNLVPLLADRRRNRLDSLGNHGREVDRTTLQLDPPLRDSRHIEKVVDEPRQMCRLAPNHAERRLDFRAAWQHA